MAMELSVGFQGFMGRAGEDLTAISGLQVRLFRALIIRLLMVGLLDSMMCLQRLKYRAEVLKRASGTNIPCQREKIDVVGFKGLDSGMVGESVYLDI